MISASPEDHRSTKRRRLASDEKRAKAKGALARHVTRRRAQLTMFQSTVCSDARVCVAFGQSRAIRSFFGEFVNMQFVKKVERLTMASKNGVVQRLHYERQGYKAYAILKSTMQVDDDDSIKDNVVYEYFVGQYLNQQCRRFPCFLETYALLEYAHGRQGRERWLAHGDHAAFPRPCVGVRTKPLEVLDDACTETVKYALLIQELPGEKGMSGTFYELWETGLETTEIVRVLAQVYFPLAVLHKAHFRHNDLHADNVYLYRPHKNGYLTYHYHFSDKKDDVITFSSPYLAKIIDYGRCYYHHTGGPAKGFLSSTDAYLRRDRYHAAQCGVVVHAGELDDVNLINDFQILGHHTDVQAASTYLKKHVVDDYDTTNQDCLGEVHVYAYHTNKAMTFTTRTKDKKQTQANVDKAKEENKENKGDNTATLNAVHEDMDAALRDINSL
jgi:hypothetical protein